MRSRTIVLLLGFTAVHASIKAEIGSGNLRSVSGAGSILDNLKATWSQTFEVGGGENTLVCSYDYSSAPYMLKESKILGKANQFAYELTHCFGSGKTGLVLNTKQQGATIKAEIPSIAEPTALGEVTLGCAASVFDKKVNLEPSLLVMSKAAKVKVASSLGGESLSADMVYKKGSLKYELGYKKVLAAGKILQLTAKPQASSTLVTYTDSTIEEGATWVAKASADTTQGIGGLAKTKLTVSRAFSF